MPIRPQNNILGGAMAASGVASVILSVESLNDNSADPSDARREKRSLVAFRNLEG
jgi:hypothetical protein